MNYDNFTEFDENVNMKKDPIEQDFIEFPTTVAPVDTIPTAEFEDFTEFDTYVEPKPSDDEEAGFEAYEKSLQEKLNAINNLTNPTVDNIAEASIIEDMLNANNKQYLDKLDLTSDITTDIGYNSNEEYTILKEDEKPMTIDEQATSNIPNMEGLTDVIALEDIILDESIPTFNSNIDTIDEKIQSVNEPVEDTYTTVNETVILEETENIDYKEPVVLEDVKMDKDVTNLQEEIYVPTETVTTTEDIPPVISTISSNFYKEEDIYEVEDKPEEPKPISTTVEENKNKLVMSYLAIDVDEAMENIEKLQRDELSHEEARAFAEKLANPDTLEYKVRYAIDNLFNTNRVFNHAVLEQAKENNHKLSSKAKIGDLILEDSKTNRNNILNKIKNNVTYSAANKETYTLMNALIHSLKKIHLYNSGYNLTLRPPLEEEFREFLRRCDIATDEYGRRLGGLFYMPIGVEIQNALCDLVEVCVTESNLKDFKENFKACTSILDYETLIWGLATLTHKYDAEAKYICYNKDCKNIDSVTIDLDKCRINDYTKLSVEALKFTHDTAIRTVSDLEYYRNTILNDSISVKLDSDDANDEAQMTVELKVPNLNAVFNNGLEYLSEMTMKINHKKEKDLADYLQDTYYKALAPWVNKIIYDNKATNASITFVDVDKGSNILGTMMNFVKSLNKQVNELIVNTKISHYCYTYTACPVCHKPSDMAVDNLIPIDIQTDFFTLVSAKLIYLAEQ